LNLRAREASDHYDIRDRNLPQLRSWNPPPYPAKNTVPGLGWKEKRESTRN